MGRKTRDKRDMIVWEIEGERERERGRDRRRPPTAHVAIPSPNRLYQTVRLALLFLPLDVSILDGRQCGWLGGWVAGWVCGCVSV